MVQYSGRTTARTSAGRFKPTRDRAFRRHVFVGLRSRAVSYCKPRAFVPTPYMLVTSSVDPPQGTTCGVNVYRDNVYSCRELRKYSTHDGPRQQDAARRQGTVQCQAFHIRWQRYLRGGKLLYTF